jgi:tRNA uridine 5-carboxymethylaminomethyl modification enzyme
MGRLIDGCGIHFRILNGSRGLAVRGPRAQADKVKYRRAARRMLEATPHLQLREGTAAKLLWREGTRALRGLELLDGSVIPCDAVVLTAGTFLNGRILMGETRQPAGRAGEPPSTELAEQLRALGLRHRRLKTGTSPRLLKASIDVARMEPQPGDDPPRPFSFFSDRIPQPQVECHIVHTTALTASIVRENLSRSALYGGHIEGVGPRYCPSLEDKFVKFPHHAQHQVFVEPESLETEEIYLSGFSTSMPPEVQQAMVRSLPGFERAEILRPGYAIEYDSFDPLQLRRDLAMGGLDGVWFAGQVNGTTGYEEAAGQGLLAGINAARALLDKEPVILGRDQAYLGVMVDDLVTKGTDEPYRMLTARAEHRLSLACDLADERLLDLAREIGALGDSELARLESRVSHRTGLREAIEAARVTPSNAFGALAAQAGLRLESGMSLADLFRRQQIGPAEADRALAMLGSAEAPVGWDAELERDLLLFEVRYGAYREREVRLLQRERDWDAIRIPEDFFVEAWPGFSNEVREKLGRHRPETLGQASRIPGVTPAAVTLLHLMIEKRRSA